MTARRARTGVSILAATVGGLALAGGTSAAWVNTETAREVGGVAVGDVAVTTGLELAPQGLTLGLVAAAAGLALLVLRGRGQVVAAIVLVLAGVAALASALAGLAAAPPGEIGGGALVVLGGAAAVVAAGVLGLRPAPPPRLPARYDLDAGDDDEWRIASAEDAEREGDGS
jgi:hypothetical protein